MNCSLCKQKIEVTVLGKIVGTFLKNKKFLLCANCQKAYGEEAALKQLGVN